MGKDGPTSAEFVSWNSYQIFSQGVRQSRRYVWEPEVRAFLDVVLATARNRDFAIPKGDIFYRAQRGVVYEPTFDEEGNEVGEEPVGYGHERMKPLKDRAIEGRVNPTGIPILYLASSEETAISEIRPWMGSEISVAQFRIARDLKVINLSAGHGEFAMGALTFSELAGEKAADAKKKEKVVWTEIDNAFSRPVTVSDNSADYVPTQILSELFWSAGYDAIVYRSQFGEMGYNIAILNADDAEVINCAPYRTKSVKIEFGEIGNRWYSTTHLRRLAGAVD